MIVALLIVAAVLLFALFVVALRNEASVARDAREAASGIRFEREKLGA